MDDHAETLRSRHHHLYSSNRIFNNLPKRFRSVHLREDIPLQIRPRPLGEKTSTTSARKTTPPPSRKFSPSRSLGLVQSGLDITLLASTDKTSDKVVVLINVTKERLKNELLVLNGEHEGFSNNSDIQALEDLWDSETVDDMLFDRPAWHREDPVKGRVIESDSYEKFKWEGYRYMTYADEIQCIARILRAPRDPVLAVSTRPGMSEEKIKKSQELLRGAGVDVDRPLNKRGHVVIEDMFPLHDDKFSMDYLYEIRPKTSSRTRNYLGDYWFIEELRYHMGERVAYYFAFQQLYTEHLKPIAFLGVFLWIIFRLIVPSAIVYFRILALYGFLVATIWGPALLRYWYQRTNELNYRWGLTFWQDDLDPNPDFDWGENKENSRIVSNAVDVEEAKQTFFRFCRIGEDVVDIDGFKQMCQELPGLEHLDSLEKQDAKFRELDTNGSGDLELDEFLLWAQKDPQVNYIIGIRPANPPWRRWWDTPIAYIELFLLGIFLAVSILAFIYWYVSAMLIPVCSENDSRSWPNCFGTAGASLGSGRWLYVFLQGLTLGIFLDTLLEAFVKHVVGRHSEAKNFPTLKAKEDYYTSHLFGYLWMGWFLWYGLLGLVYVPFGSWIQAAQRIVLGDHWVNEWVPGAISMDTAMVTPLIVTQALNLLLDTLIPYLHYKYGETPLESSGPMTLGKPIAAASVDDDSFHTKPVTDESSEKASLVNTGHGESATRDLFRSIQSDPELKDKVYITETIPTWGWDDSGDKPIRKWKSSIHILEESQRGQWSFFSQMLDPAIQFSYCVNFSAIWPMTALCAYINNYFEVKSDVIQMLLGSRRPTPRKVNGIGAWNGCLHFAAAAGIFFTIGMICVASSGIEAFIAPESCGLTNDDFTMTPAIGCIGHSGNRIATLLVLEHLAVIIGYSVYQSISRWSDVVGESKLRSSLKMRQDFESHFISKID